MGKTLETKKKILSMLKEKKMTVGEISESLGLSHATVSQHISELQKAGAVEKIDNEHFKKLKYYKAGDNSNTAFLKYAIGAIIAIIILGSVIYLNYTSNTGGNIYVNQTTTTTPTINESNNLGSPVSINNGAEACPMIFYSLNGSVVKSSGFAKYYINTTSYGTVQDFVINKGSLGIIYANETITGMLNESNSKLYNRTHYVYISTMKNGFNYTTVGINATINPINFTAANNEKLNVTLTLYTSQTATNQTYWLHIDGPCGGGVKPVLITVGNTEYNGNVAVPVIPFA